MRRRSIVVVGLVLGLLAAACGGGEEAAPTTTTTSTTTSTTTTTAPPPPVSALTGMPVDDEEIVERPVVAVKYDNVHGKSTPQSGIGAADVVYEVTVEGEVTRFLALFQSTDAGPVGPVRSARGSEIGLLEELNNPLFTWHGANGVLRRAVRSSSIVPRSIDDIPQLFYRDGSRPSPYNSFATGTAEIRETAPEDVVGPDHPILAFAGEDDEIGSPLGVEVFALNLRFPPAFSGGIGGRGVPVRFEWDGERWLRFQAGEPHLDADGEQLAVENVIVRATDAIDSGTRDTAGSRVPTAVVTGEGVAWVFTDGTVTVGTWSKPDNQTRTTYLDQNGDEILLAPGRTWIAMPYGLGSSSFE